MDNLVDQPITPNLFDKGYDAFGQSPLVFSGIEENKQAASAVAEGLPSTFIQDGDLVIRLTVVDGYLQSPDYVAGVSGWRLDPTTIEIDNGIFRGTVSVGSGTVFEEGYDPIGKANTFAQDAVPVAIAAGDLWVDTNDSNKLYRAEIAGSSEISPTEWVLVNDTRAADAVLKSASGQAITGNFNLNSANVLLDGANKRIVINDGTNDRILIGYLAGKF